MNLDLPTALALTQRLLGLGLMVQGLEGLVTRRAYASEGAWGWQGPAVATGLWPRMVSDEGMGLLFLVRIVACAGLIFPGVQPVSWLAWAAQTVLLGSSALLALRMRGPLCGGSDSMFFQVQLGLWVAALGTLNPLLPRLGLSWIAAQSVLSYFLAGASKLRHPGWRNGSALRHLMLSEGPYVLHVAARRLAHSSSLCILGGWGLVLFQVLFPLVLVVSSEARVALLALGCVFHLANALTLGLNRFFWAWLATYPALLHFGAAGR